MRRFLTDNRDPSYALWNLTAGRQDDENTDPRGLQSDQPGCNGSKETMPSTLLDDREC